MKLINTLGSTILRPLPLVWASLFAIAYCMIELVITNDQLTVLSVHNIWIFAISGWLVGLLSELIIKLLPNLQR